MNKVLTTVVFSLLVMAITLIGCTNKKETDLSKFVNSFIGTDRDGHTFPGAVAPFGMVQLSPDTRISGSDYASGYHYSDSTIIGFSHTRYSGTGRGSGGDFLFMPTSGEIILSEGKATNSLTGYRSSFSHKNETASPGYYKVLLDDYNVTVELTTSKRVGFHKYTFPQTELNNVILDLTHGISDRPDSLYLKVIGKNKIVGIRKSLGGLRDFQTLFFAAEFSEDFDDFGISVNGKESTQLIQANGKDIKAYFQFKSKKEVMLKVAISKVDIAGAEKNLTEIQDWDFERVKSEVRNEWNKELGKINISSNEISKYTTFYTALYHSNIMPSLDTDMDGRYRSTNHKVYTAEGFSSYTNFSLWDTFRALHPLLTIVNQEKTLDFINTFIERNENSGSMPIFEVSGNDLLVMIGYHSLPVIADAYVKGIRGFDVNKAINGMIGLADIPFEERNEYKTFGYIPHELTDQAVSRSLEFAYDDWALAQVLKGIDEKAYLHYSNRANFYKNLFDKESGFMRPKDINHQWMKDFNPMANTRKYTQGNAWQYSTFTLQDLQGLIQMMGGDKKFEKWLDTYFTTQNSSTYQGKSSSLMIGQYYHGNEPSHHSAYLYNYAGVPWKTQQMVRKIMNSQYNISPSGLSGNDDAGQMSAWYVLSSMGFYSVTPGMDYYVIGSPLFNEVTIILENGEKFKIIAKNNSPKNIYIQSASLNGKPYTKSYLKHSDIMSGGYLEFVMGAEPNKSWATSKIDRPYSEAFNDVSMPLISIKENKIGRDGIVTFKEASEVTVACDMKDVHMFYTLDGSEPDKKSKLYKGKIFIDHSTSLKIKAFKNGYIPSYTATVKFRKLEPSLALKVIDAKKGVKYNYREVWICKSTAQIDQYPILKIGVASVISSEIGFDKVSNYGLVFNGYISVPKTGTYTFYVDNEYASDLWIDGELIASNCSTDWLGERSGTIALHKGFHAIKLKNFQVGGETTLKLLWEGPGIKKEIIPESVYFN